MQLNQIICELLYRHDCVIIPGFGAFISNLTGSELNMATREIHPPKKVISFNEALQLSDGLVVNHISRTQHLSYAQAKEQVDQTVLAYQNSLSNQGFLILDQIGRITKNPEGRLEFVSESKNFNLEAFGLPVLEFYPIVRAENDSEKKALISKRLESQAIVRKSPIRQEWIPIASVAAFLLLILSVGLSRFDLGFNKNSNIENASISNNLNANRNSKQVDPETDIDYSQVTQGDSDQNPNENNLPEGETTEKNLDKTPINDLPEGKVSEKLPEDDVRSDSKEKYPVITTPTENSLEQKNNLEDKSDWIRKKIVVGAFGVESNAQSLADKIESDGYDTEIKQRGKLFHVRVLVYCEKTELPVILGEVQDQFSKSAWIL